MKDLYKILNDSFNEKWIGLIGTIDKTVPGFREFGNVMFYPINKEPYCICVAFSDLQKIS